MRDDVCIRHTLTHTMLHLLELQQEQQNSEEKDMKREKEEQISVWNDHLYPLSFRSDVYDYKATAEKEKAKRIIITKPKKGGRDVRER